MSKYPKIINHHGFELIKHDIGVYEYRSYLIVSDEVYGGFCLQGRRPEHIHISTGSLCQLCKYIDLALTKPVCPPLPIDIVTINYKSLWAMAKVVKCCEISCILHMSNDECGVPSECKKGSKWCKKFNNELYLF